MRQRIPRAWRNWNRASTNWEKWESIYRRWLNGESQAAMARELGVTRAHVNQQVHKQQYFWDNR